MTYVSSIKSAACTLLACVFSHQALADLPETIHRVKPSVVVVGTYNKLKSPPFQMRGTGFAVGDGQHIATNAHVVPNAADQAVDQDSLMVLARQGSDTKPYPAQLVARDNERDLALLRISGPALQALALGNSGRVQEGQSVAFTGFPIGGALGFSPVTHRAIISSITPIAIPLGNANELKEKAIRQLRNGPFQIFQLDGTAYPGNSGGPLFSPETGEVIGIVSMGFVKSTKESVLEKPSGISYAIPVDQLQQLLNSAGIRY